MADRQRQRFQARPDDGAAGRREGPDPSHLGSGPHQCHGRPGRRRRPCAGQCVAAHRLPRQENGRLRYPRRPVGRPGRGRARRPSHALPLARIDVRRRAEFGQLRQRLRLRVSIQHFVAVGHHADAAGAQSAAGVRAAVRRRLAGRARQKPRPPARARAIDSRFHSRRCPRAGPKAGRQGQPQARRVSHERPRDRSAHRPAREVRRPAQPECAKRRKACRSSSKSTCS